MFYRPLQLSEILDLLVHPVVLVSPAEEISKHYALWLPQHVGTARLNEQVPGLLGVLLDGVLQALGEHLLVLLANQTVREDAEGLVDPKAHH